MENGTLNVTSTDESVSPLMIVEYVLFTIIFIVGVVGNILVCLVILKTPSMRSTRNYLIVNLAIADITVALVCIPFDVIIRVYGEHWVLGAGLCKIIWPSMTLVTTCSAATLAAISYDRYVSYFCTHGNIYSLYSYICSLSIDIVQWCIHGNPNSLQNKPL